jgi:hypothetical protein
MFLPCSHEGGSSSALATCQYELTKPISRDQHTYYY